MISYGFSVQGKSHIERGTVCQDYSMVVTLMGGWYLGIVADGVGSAIHSDIGSKMATEALAEFCKKNQNSQMTETKWEEVLCQGYDYAMQKIVKYAEKKNDALENYDTTLSSVLYNGEKVIYGHAGDGGILVRLWNGKIQPVTERQKGADGSSVRPLRAGESSWDFGVCQEKVASVLLLTDGMLDGVFQPVLVNLPSDLTALASGRFEKNNVYVTACEFFMNPMGVYSNKESARADNFIKKYIDGNLEREDQTEFLKCMQRNYNDLLGREQAKEVCKRIEKYYYAVWALKNVTDDKSVVCLMNEKAKVTPQNTEYYYEPNWKWRQERYNALLYGKPMPPEPEDDSLYQRGTAENVSVPAKKGDDGKDTVTESKNRTGTGEIIKTNYGYKLNRSKIPYIFGIIIVIFLIFIIGIVRLSLSNKQVAEEPKTKRMPTFSEKPFATSSDAPAVKSYKEEIEEVADSILATYKYRSGRENNDEDDSTLQSTEKPIPTLSTSSGQNDEKEEADDELIEKFSQKAARFFKEELVKKYQKLEQSEKKNVKEKLQKILDEED